MIESRRYICEVCHTEYAEKKMALQCEQCHKQDLSIVGARYLPFIMDKTGLPASITIEYMEGNATRQATYKR